MEFFTYESVAQGGTDCNGRALNEDQVTLFEAGAAGVGARKFDRKVLPEDKFHHCSKFSRLVLGSLTGMGYRALFRAFITAAVKGLRRDAESPGRSFFLNAQSGRAALFLPDDHSIDNRCLGGSGDFQRIALVYDQIRILAYF